MSNIQIDTIDLRDLLKKVDDTGVNAWRVGNVAERIKNDKSFIQIPNKKYKLFGEYTINELGKEESTIDIYIKIKQSFNLEDVKNVLFSHLAQLSRLKDSSIRKTALKAFKNIQKQFIAEADSTKKDKLFTEANIKNVVDVLLVSYDLNESKIEGIVQEVLRFQKQKQIQKKTDKVGKELKTDFFKELEQLISYEPIDEQGTVALFCLMFPFLKNRFFKTPLDGSFREIAFNKIQLVRSRFPDAIFTCSERTRKTEINHIIRAEFEFLSSSYIDHVLSKEDCNFIICWESDTDRSKFPVHAFPPIIELKKILLTGEIVIS